jgi:hypothetical protein
MNAKESSEINTDLIKRSEEAIERIDEQRRSGKCITGNYAEMMAARMVPELVIEIKQLREQLVAWKKIAVEERIQNNMKDKGPNGECRATIEHQLAGYPRCVYCLDTGNYKDCPMLGHFSDQAIKELGLQMTREASYLERLERLALSLCMEAGWSQEDFEAALDKIREG